MVILDPSLDLDTVVTSQFLVMPYTASSSSGRRRRRSTSSAHAHQVPENIRNSRGDVVDIPERLLRLAYELGLWSCRDRKNEDAKN